MSKKVNKLIIEFSVHRDCFKDNFFTKYSYFVLTPRKELTDYQISRFSRKIRDRLKEEIKAKT